MDNTEWRYLCLSKLPFGTEVWGLEICLEVWVHKDGNMMRTEGSWKEGFWRLFGDTVEDEARDDLNDQLEERYGLPGMGLGGMEASMRGRCLRRIQIVCDILMHFFFQDMRCCSRNGRFINL
ncbi:hypothetical protein TESG_04625 [Trichophyton tonsurans CBS 112818]|uniref:Uncharacterized protein n=1 Tax=Trichophyton tonsurans (strain CBS 112818) TaxID=647933 RepID=F2S0W2_TRIT1|nr:hypothetical protein TESG_04625 [Trichophyton tonsurans CBS 112818]